MADTAAATPAKKVKTPKKKAAAKKPADHPKYSAMVKTAVANIKDKKGASTQAIKKYIEANFKVDKTKVNTQVKKALIKMVKDKSLKQRAGTGAAGRFSVGEKAEKKAKKPKTKKATKPKAAKPAAKKVKKPKAAAKKSPKKAKAAKPKAAKPKSPKKTKAAKPKKAKTPKKKPAAKKAAK